LITLRIGTSLISQDQANLNLKREVGLKSFDDLIAEARAEWHSRLSRAMLEDVGNYPAEQQESLKTVFYSTMYRASMFPRQISEVDANGNTVHWSPYDGKGNVYDGPLSTDSGFWDAYVAVYPYNTLVNRDILGSEMMAGWLNSYKEGGWIPKWACPGYAVSMVGTMQDVALSDAIVKNIPGFDRELAYEAIAKDAFQLPPQGVNGLGRVCLDSYLKYGYIPRGAPITTGGECYEIIARSLNYMQSDWAIANAATVLGKTDDAALLYQRAKNFTLLFEKETGFLRSRDESGAFTTPFDEFAWGDDYTEGGPWQYRFYAPHDPQGLSAMYEATNRSVCDLLEQAMTMKSIFHIGGYGGEIHEQTEMPVNVWGQYEHNNQPAHYMLYMFQATDPQGISGSCAAKGMYWLRKAMTTLYKPGMDMFPGDEDNGEMSSWFLLSSLGLYELAPGSDDYTLGAPLFAKVVVQLDGDKTLTIEAPNNGAESMYVQSVSWNGQLLTGSPLKSVKYDTLMQGGTLTFKMGPKPVTEVSQIEVATM
jgi:predicted alpha-1,2-mannosidase